MSYYPIYLELEGKIVLVVGGGSVARRKVEVLLAYGAIVHIVSKSLSPELNNLVETGSVLQIGEVFDNKHLDDAFLAIAATDDTGLNHVISQEARKRGILVNAVDQPLDCDFIVPSIIRKGNLSIAISTSGKSPALAKKIRKQMDLLFGKEYERFLVLMGTLRPEILSLGLKQEENSRIFHEIVHSDILGALADEKWGEVEEILNRILPKPVAAKDIINGLEKS